MAELATSVPTVALDATLADARLAIGTQDFLLVVTDERIVLGKVLARSLAPDDVGDQPVETVMIEGPTTVRASESLPELVERMERARTSSVVVTSNQGELIGVLFTETARGALEQLAAEHHHH